MKRTELAATIAARIQYALFRAEAGQDQSLDRLGRLTLALTKGRRDAGLAATVGQPAFDALARAVAAQVASQKAMGELHDALADVKNTTRFRSVRLGGLQKSETDIPRETRLSLVEKRV